MTKSRAYNMVRVIESKSKYVAIITGLIVYSGTGKGRIDQFTLEG